MNISDIVILSIIEGVTEFLPVSSTGHLIIVSEWLDINIGAFNTSFQIAIQLGAILAVMTMYWRSFLNQNILYRLLWAFLPTAVLGFIFYPIIKNYLLHSQVVVITMFFLGGLALIFFEWWYVEGPNSLKEIENISFKNAFIIGLFQSIALIPGVSRSAATILGGLWLGFNRRTILEFSFLLAVPTIAAATGYDLLKNVSEFSGGEIKNLILGFSLSFVFALVTVKFLLVYINRYSFIPFGFYRVFVALILLFIFLF